uniref:Uncharacterized protein n=1 Tax=Steinernema glaseri TaxID=37863 RepID=A0A1I7ZSG1_9BILA
MDTVLHSIHHSRHHSSCRNLHRAASLYSVVRSLKHLQYIINVSIRAIHRSDDTPTGIRPVGRYLKPFMTFRALLSGKCWRPEKQPGT